MKYPLRWHKKNVGLANATDPYGTSKTIYFAVKYHLTVHKYGI